MESQWVMALWAKLGFHSLMPKAYRQLYGLEPLDTPLPPEIPPLPDFPPKATDFSGAFLFDSNTWVEEHKTVITVPAHGPLETITRTTEPLLLKSCIPLPLEDTAFRPTCPVLQHQPRIEVQHIFLPAPHVLQNLSLPVRPQQPCDAAPEACLFTFLVFLFLLFYAACDIGARFSKGNVQEPYNEPRPKSPYERVKDVVDSVTTVLEPFGVANEPLSTIAASLVKRLRTTSFLAFGLQIALEAAQKRVQVLEAVLEERDDAAHSFSRLIQSLSNMYKKLKQECAGLEKTVKLLKTENLVVKTNCEKLQEGGKDDSDLLEQQKGTITLFRQLYRRCRRFSEELREKLKGLEELVGTLRADVLSTETRNKALQQENDILATQLRQRTRTGEIVCKLFHSFRKAHAEKVAECAAFKAAAERRDKAIEDLTGSYENVSRDLAAQKAERTRREQEIRILLDGERARYAQKCQDLADLQTAKTASEAKRQALQRRYTTLQQQEVSSGETILGQQTSADQSKIAKASSRGSTQSKMSSLFDLGVAHGRELDAKDAEIASLKAQLKHEVEGPKFIAELEGHPVEEQQLPQATEEVKPAEKQQPVKTEKEVKYGEFKEELQVKPDEQELFSGDEEEMNTGEVVEAGPPHPTPAARPQQEEPMDSTTAACVLPGPDAGLSAPATRPEQLVAIDDQMTTSNIATAATITPAPAARPHQEAAIADRWLLPEQQQTITDDLEKSIWAPKATDGDNDDGNDKDEVRFTPDGRVISNVTGIPVPLTAAQEQAELGEGGGGGGGGGGRRRRRNRRRRRH